MSPIRQPRPHPCPGCGELTTGEACSSCADALAADRRARRRARDARKDRGDLDTREARRARAALIERHLETIGPVCPGWRRTPHLVRPDDLTADHVDPRADGHTWETTELAVLCRPCNGAKGAR